ncbi:MAG: DoxX family protein [Candidatus Acidiferrales bacterium]
MSVLFLMLAVFALLHLPALRSVPLFRTRRDKAAAAMAVMFFFTGSDHFLNPQRYLPMMPPVLPPAAQPALIYISGFCELAGATGLLIRRTRRWAAWGLIALLIAIFPANIYVALSRGSIAGLPSSAWYYWARLPIQFIFIAWAWWIAKGSDR